MSEALSENIKEVKSILDITDSKLDKYLIFCEKVLIDKILDICNINIIPERLNSLIQEFLIEQYNLNKDGIGEGKKEVSNVSDNGQSASFKTVGGIESVRKNAEEFLNQNIKILYTYRKLKKRC